MIYKKTKNLSIIAGLALVLSACTGVPRNTHNQLAVEPDSVSLRLASAVDRASAALQTLAATEQKRVGGVRAPLSVPNAPIQLMRTVTLDWSGPIEPLAQKLADRASYKFQVQGDEPAVPVIVNVTAVEKPVIEVLRDIGLQAGSRADVVVDAERQTVEVSYSPGHSG